MALLVGSQVSDRCRLGYLLFYLFWFVKSVMNRGYENKHFIEKKCYIDIQKVLVSILEARWPSGRA